MSKNAANSQSSLVIGYGNEWRGDDGLGPAVAREVERLGLPGVRVLTTHQLLPELAEELSHFERVVFIDARIDDSTAPVTVERLSAVGGPLPITHHCHPQFLLGMTAAAFEHAPLAWLVSVQGEQFDLGETLSVVAMGRLADGVRLVAELLNPPEQTSVGKVTGGY